MTTLTITTSLKTTSCAVCGMLFAVPEHFDSTSSSPASDSSARTHPTNSAPRWVRVSLDRGDIPAATAATARRYRGAGTGIGLALARTLIEADGGRLVLSNPEHAEFRIVLVGATRPD